MFGQTMHYGHHAHGYFGGHGIMDTVIHAVINGLIYSFIFKLMRSLTLPEALILVVAVIAMLWLMVGRQGRRY